LSNFFLALRRRTGIIVASLIFAHSGEPSMLTIPKAAAHRLAPAITPVLFLVFVVLIGPPAVAQTKYRSAQEAWSVGVAFYNSRNFEASREPFEAALTLAPDDKFRLKVYEALLPSYRLLPASEKFIAACEFILSKSESSPQQSLTRRQLLAFVHQRGKTDELARRHEEALKKDPNDRLALYVLSELYAELKRDPQRAAALIERLAKIEQKGGQQVNVQQTANLAQQYVKAKKFKEGAELYEQIAPLDANLAAWHWKEAAVAWLKVGDKQKALEAAKQSDASPPEARNDLLAHFWHRGLADAFLATGEPEIAVLHYEKAIEKTNIQGYIDDCKKSLAEAKAQAGRK
jgi:tetratricopeptide (TPR) repeat protein